MEQQKFEYLVLAFLALLIPGCQAECFQSSQGTCSLAQKQHKIDEVWVTKDCYQCRCISESEIICCDMVNYTVDFRQHCDIWYDATTCQLSLLCGRHLKLKDRRCRRSTKLIKHMPGSRSKLRK